MDRPTCRTCPYWDSGGEEDSGICRKSCPKTAKPQYEGDYSAFPVWPITLDTEWCGEHPDFPAYLAGLKKPVVDGSITLRQALDLGRTHGISNRAFHALGNRKNVCGEANQFLDRPLNSITEQELMNYLRNFGQTSALEFRRWREAIMAGQNGTPVSSGASPSG